jgi:hypothetical protein
MTKTCPLLHVIMMIVCCAGTTSCLTGIKSEPMFPLVSVSELMREPVSRNGQNLCVAGRWRKERGLLALEAAVPSSSDALTRGQLIVNGFNGTVRNRRSTIVCGKIELEPKCFGYGLVVGEDYVCAPLIVEITAVHKKR